MTCREKLAKEHPDMIDPNENGGCRGCPSSYGYLVDPDYCVCDESGMLQYERCDRCWSREIPEKNDTRKSEEIVGHPDPVGEPGEPGVPVILDSGNRRQFESGAVRDIHEGKGRCDLLPLDVVSEYYLRKQIPKHILFDIWDFTECGDVDALYLAIQEFSFEHFKDDETMLLEVAIHFEEGAKKYGDNNWRKGIPVRCYIDSAVRHYLKFLRGDRDEPHDRAFCWNIMCAIWTCKHKPELNDYGKPPLAKGLEEVKKNLDELKDLVNKGREAGVSSGCPFCDGEHSKPMEEPV
jgi:hypothetical protein